MEVRITGRSVTVRRISEEGRGYRATLLSIMQSVGLHFAFRNVLLFILWAVTNQVRYLAACNLRYPPLALTLAPVVLNFMVRPYSQKCDHASANFCRE